jgi:hypothetical protein
VFRQACRKSLSQHHRRGGKHTGGE